MPITLTKEVALNKVSTVYGVVLGSELINATFVWTVKNVIIGAAIANGDSAVAEIGLTINGVQAPQNTKISFPYDPDGGDVIKQVENYVIKQDGYTAGTIS